MKVDLLAVNDLIEVVDIVYHCRVVLDVAATDITVLDKAGYISCSVKLGSLVVCSKAGITIAEYVASFLNLLRHGHVYLEAIVICLYDLHSLVESVTLCCELKLHTTRECSLVERSHCVEIIVSILNDTLIDPYYHTRLDIHSRTCLLEDRICNKSWLLRNNVVHLDCIWSCNCEVHIVSTDFLYRK